MICLSEPGRYRDLHAFVQRAGGRWGQLEVRRHRPAHQVLALLRVCVPVASPSGTCSTFGAVQLLWTGHLVNASSTAAGIGPGSLTGERRPRLLPHCSFKGSKPLWADAAFRPC